MVYADGTCVALRAFLMARAAGAKPEVLRTLQRAAEAESDAHAQAREAREWRVAAASDASVAAVDRLLADLGSNRTKRGDACR
jgi:hypothetical protein